MEIADEFEGKRDTVFAQHNSVPQATLLVNEQSKVLAGRKVHEKDHVDSEGPTLETPNDLSVLRRTDSLFISTTLLRVKWIFHSSASKRARRKGEPPSIDPPSAHESWHPEPSAF